MGKDRPGQGQRLNNPRDKPRSIAHLSDTVDSNLSHAIRHLDAAKKAPNKSARDANLEHSAKHMQDVYDHQQRLGELLATIPAVGAEQKKLAKANPNYKRKAPK